VVSTFLGFQVFHEGFQLSNVASPVVTPTIPVRLAEIGCRERLPDSISDEMRCNECTVFFFMIDDGVEDLLCISFSMKIPQPEATRAIQLVPYEAMNPIQGMERKTSLNPFL
jgi:hypothetical protein